MPAILPTSHLFCEAISDPANFTIKGVPSFFFDNIAFFEEKGFNCEILNPDGGNFAKYYTCHQCPTGYRSVPDKTVFQANSCTLCPAGGYYQDEVGQSHCKECANGTYVEPSLIPAKKAASCHVCPHGTDTDRHAGSRACYCLPSHCRTNRFGKCDECNEPGQRCVNDYLSVRKGYWWSWNISNNASVAEMKKQYIEFIHNSEIKDFSYLHKTVSYTGTVPKIYPCPIKESCNGSKDDKSSMRVRDEEMCSSGYTGTLCGKCIPGYYSFQMENRSSNFRFNNLVSGTSSNFMRY
eukprot:m.1873 g.1873  ORF g.1873 m.1873 type:complete len:294 (+) comp7997_c0_seq1:3-884(+)